MFCASIQCKCKARHFGIECAHLHCTSHSVPSPALQGESMLVNTLGHVSIYCNSLGRYYCTFLSQKYNSPSPTNQWIISPLLSSNPFVCHFFVICRTRPSPKPRNAKDKGTVIASAAQHLQLAETIKKMTLCALTIGCKRHLFRDSENKTRKSQTLQSSHMSPPSPPPLSRPFDAHSPLFLGRSERDGPPVILDGACSCNRWRSCTSTNARRWISPSPRGSSRTLSSRGLRTRSLVGTIGYGGEITV